MDIISEFEYSGCSRCSAFLFERSEINDDKIIYVFGNFRKNYPYLQDFHEYCVNVENNYSFL